MNSTWSSISAGVRSRTLPAMVEAQKAHPIRHPTWEEMHTVLPWWYCMSTVSMQLPSDSSQRYLMVPSNRDTCLRATCGGGDETGLRQLFPQGLGEIGHLIEGA